MTEPNSLNTAEPFVPAKVQLLAYVSAALVVVWKEFPVWLNEAKRSDRLSGWLTGVEAEGLPYLPYLPFLLLFPFCWFGFQRNRRPTERNSFVVKLFQESPCGEQRSLATAWLFALIVFAITFGMSYRTGLEFANLPPAYHDEYSYSLQSELFSEGKWSAPSFSEAPDLFDQMHVLNEGKFASRYFPGTSLWMAPFQRLGNPWLGHQLAQAICAMMVFWIGRELSNSGTGFVAGVLFALSPGLILFSNLLLGHHPTLVSLTIFLWSFLRMMRLNSPINSLLAGSGLAFAMICRPMTAAGFALPFGIIFVWWWLTGKWRFRGESSGADLVKFSQRSRFIIAMAIPLAVGFVLLGVQNKAMTGSVFNSPYETYNEIYTPRHVYGFQNVTRGERGAGPLVSDEYDRWAGNLTSDLAIENLQTRLLNSWNWTLAIVPLLATTIVFLLTSSAGDRRWLLIGLSILSLHLAHIPYWFSGIMGWHYVFETAPLWLLICAEATRRLFRQWSLSGRWMMKYCWLLFLGTAISTNLWTIKPLWPARLARGTIELKYPRQLYANFREQIDLLSDGNPVIVFVVPDRDDVSMDYVTNSPDWQQRVLVARISDRTELNRYTPLFPNRIVLLFDAHSRTFERIPITTLQPRNSK